MIKIGITGGLGSGKTVVCELLKVNGIPVYNSDIEAKRLMNESNIIRKEIEELLGESSYIDGLLNRAYISQRVFSDKSLLTALNNIVHPEVRKDFLQWASTQRSDIVAIESAILFESKLSSLLDKVITVSADKATRIKRVELRDGLKETEITTRINAQISDLEREELADYVISNNKQALIPQINQILASLISS